MHDFRELMGQTEDAKNKFRMEGMLEDEKNKNTGERKVIIALHQ